MYCLYNAIQVCWYNRNKPNLFLLILLFPFSIIYFLCVKFRKSLYKNNILKSYKLNVPTIIVGNITVGGTGKTPVVIYLANLLKQQGLTPGILSRGYKGRNKQIELVIADSDPVKVGDEAVLLAKRSNCPVVVGINRVNAGESLLKNFNVNVIICDDGLQHYSLKRDLEIAVIDGVNRFGNGYNLPMGPLREPIDRLEEVDFVIVNGEKFLDLDNAFTMNLSCTRAYKVSNTQSTTESCEIVELTKTKVHAIAGIGFPNKFFDYLKKLGFEIIPHSFIDHHCFKPEDLNFKDEYPIVMTEKDAIKCKRFAKDNAWFIPINIALSENFDKLFLGRVLKRKVL